MIYDRTFVEFNLTEFHPESVLFLLFFESGTAGKKHSTKVADSDNCPQYCSAERTFVVLLIEHFYLSS